MPCPFFLPDRKLDPSRWAIPPRTPLGVAWEGTCCADPDRPQRPDHDSLWNWCNFGYARGNCVYFPTDCAEDAVRFVQQKDATLWIVESDHVPLRSGEVSADSPRILQGQAEAFRNA